MSDVGDLLELLHGAADRWTTVQTSVRVWRHVETGSRAVERWTREVQQRGGAVSTMRAVSGEEQPSEHEQTTRIWIAKPDRWREEHDGHVSAGRRRLWWASSPHHGLMSNENDPEVGRSGPVVSFAAHLDPARIIPFVTFEDIRTDGDRILARARPRPTESFGPVLPHGADDHQLTVDRHRGAVLRTESFLEGSCFTTSELVDPIWDAELVDDLFFLSPPPGEPVRSPRELHARLATIEEAAERASFTVFAISELPDGHWRMHIIYNAATRAQPDSLHVMYYRADGRGAITLGQQPGHVDHHTYGGDQAHVEREREGTRITISSESYDEDALRALVDTLERV